MSLSRTFRGHVHRLGDVNKGLGSYRRPTLIVELDAAEAAALAEQLGPEPLRARNLPIVFALGEAAGALATIRDELQPAERQDEPPALEIELLRAILAQLVALNAMMRALDVKPLEKAAGDIARAIGGAGAGRML
ncbi:hypothetical protein [Enterovirga rhinocerotis]|uniref:Uncharacterized protein n=1 Tax=Enterovirga rhinocerotis TaxID=1339210 RepID=A0A4V3DYW0_9HYPH|nr:hypothetical protein [Enterovirga rhinocerotis]TDR94169.1 hypothetical protein EV668_1446 [Enterovirga rhinocerotis]